MSLANEIQAPVRHADRFRQRSSRLTLIGFAALAAAAMALATTAPLASAAPVGPAKCTTGPQPPVVGPTSTLNGVAVVSVCDAWAVGTRTISTADGNRQRTLVEHWNGTDWIPVASPNPITTEENDYLLKVTALSDTNVWAVGVTENGDLTNTLVEHFSGKKWRVVSSPDPGGKFGATELAGIWAASASDIWAAGSAQFGFSSAIIEHWNGTKWRAAIIPNPAGTTSGTYLDAIAGSSRSRVWAVGEYCHDGNNCLPEILQWNGKSWRSVTGPAFPSPDAAYLTAISVQSKDSAWAVGSVFAKSEKWALPLIEHWNGKVWRRVSVPSVPYGYLSGVDAFSAGSAVAIGSDAGVNPQTTLILTWNGTKWVRQPNQHPFGASLNYSPWAVAGSSCSTAWIVGGAYQVANFQLPLAVHC